VAVDKEHIKRIKESKFVRQREKDTATLRSNCTSGYRFGDATAQGQSAVHHIVAISSLQDGQIKPWSKIKFFRDCMAVTEWDTNQGPNLINLPLKNVYASADRYSPTDMVASIRDMLPGMGNVDAALGVFGAVPDLPCHQWEHGEYNTEQVIDLKKNIWEPLAENQEACKVDGKSIQGELESASVAWRQFLTARGSEHGGAALCWRNRNKPGYDVFWYIPFSMNPGTPKKVNPPPDLSEKEGTVKAWLKALFNLVK
jgi:hypothetical protein